MEWLFDSSAFLPRSAVGMPPAMTTVYQTCCILHFLGHTSIPLHMLYIWYRKRHAMPCPGTLIWLAISTGLCGLPYLFGALTFYWPAYRLNTAVLALSAGATMVMAALFFWITPYVLRLQTPGEYQKELEEAARREAKQSLYTVDLETRLQASLSRIVQLEDELQHLQFRLQTRETCDAQLATLSALRKDG